MDASSDQDSQKRESFQRPSEEINDWKPFKKVLQDLDNQSPDIHNISVTYAGNIESWTRMSTEKMRQSLTRRFMRLFELWVLIGLIVFIVTGNIWLLTTAGLLGIPILRILNYYFHHFQRKR